MTGIPRVAGRSVMAYNAAATVSELMQVELPRSTAPASRSRRTTSASSEGMWCCRTALAAVSYPCSSATCPLRQVECREAELFHSPRLISASARCASSMADSAVTVMKAFKRGSSFSIWARHALVKSTGDTSLVWTAWLAWLRSSNANC